MDDRARARQLHQSGRLGEALAAYQRAVQLHPHDDILWHDVGICLMQAGQRADAARAFSRIPPGSRTHAAACIPQALCLRDSGQPEAALPLATHATTMHPEDGSAWLLLGTVLIAVGRPDDAEVALRRAIDRAPAQLEAHHHLGVLLQGAGRHAEAIAAYTPVLARHPSEAFNIAQCREHLRDWLGARDDYRAAHRAAPHRADILARLAHVEALLCDFAACSATTRLLAERLDAPQPAPDDLPPPFSCSHLALSSQHLRRVLDRTAAATVRGIQPLPTPHARPPGPLRVGYLSADLGAHTVGHLVRGLFAAHAPDRVTVHLYSTQPHADTLEQQLAASLPHYRNVSALPDDALARLIRADDIDVLVDMSGHTHGGRPRALAMRPARLQLGWLGHIGPQHSPWLDALVLDAAVAPASADWPYADRVVRLRSSLFPATQDPCATGVRADHGLPTTGVLAASFNTPYKLSAALVDAWIRIFNAVPDARFALYLPEQSRPAFLQYWQSGGGNTTQLVLLDTLPPAQHLQRMACCDLFLDAFDYQAGATAIDAAGARLPILCTAGTLPMARLAVSINHQIGMDALVCVSTEDYIARAVALLSDPSHLAALRRRLDVEVPASGLFDARRSARDLEDLYTMLLPSPSLPPVV